MFKIIKMLEHTERQTKRCFFCGTNLSVKYLVEIDKPDRAPKPVQVYVCNSCVYHNAQEVTEMKPHFQNTYTQLQMEVINRLAEIEQQDANACANCGGEDCICCEIYHDRQKWVEPDELFG